MTASFCRGGIGMFKSILPRSIVLVLATCLCSAADASTRWGIVIGVQRYESRTVPLLEYSINDAQNVCSTLVGPCNYPRDNVKLLHSDMGDANSPATGRANLMSEIQGLLKQPGPDDVVFIYFSGHGFIHDSKLLLATWACRPSAPSSTGLPSSW